jgi:hypothetical protein
VQVQWYRVPEEMRLELPGDQWLLVKKYLTAGEERDIMAHMMKRMVAGQAAEMDPRMVQVAQVVAYLIDWSLPDAAGRPVVIREQPYDQVLDALNNMDSGAFKIINDAIDAHAKAMAAEREYEKKVSSGATAPSPTSASVA